MNEVERLEEVLQTMKRFIVHVALEPFDRGQLETGFEKALTIVAGLKNVPGPVIPARAPGKHEPEPIAPPFGRNKPPARARKRA